MKTQILLHLKSLKRGLWGGTGLVLCLLFFLSSCTMNSQITMTTKDNDEISIKIAGSGKITIDWGDGATQGYTLLGNSSTTISHLYATAANYTITITNGDITSLTCFSSQLMSLDVSGCATLTDLGCSYNNLTSLDISSNTALAALYCSGNQLTSLDVSKNTALTLLRCESNQLTSLDVSKNTALTTLNCSGIFEQGALQSLDVSGCTALTTLYCYSNQLTSLNVSGCTALTTLFCPDNHLTSLDVSGCTALTALFCLHNHLTSLNVSGCTALTALDCRYNQLATVALNSLFGILHNNIIANGKFIIIKNNPGTKTCDQSIATANGWVVNTTD